MNDTLPSADRTRRSGQSRRRPALCAVLALLLISGCIEFEKQTVLIRLDPAADEVRIRLIYHGIYAGGEDLKEDLAQLRDVAARGTRFFLLDNWPLDFDVGPPREGGKLEEANAFLRPYVTVRNGTFFLDAEGKLSAWQDLRIKKAGEFLDKVNRLTNDRLLAETNADLDVSADAETARLCRDAAKAGHAWFRLDGEGLRFVFFASDADAAKMKREALRDLMQKEKENVGHTEADWVAMLAGNRLSWTHRGHEIAIGLSPDARGRVRLDCPSRKPYVPNLLDRAAEGGDVLPLPLDLSMLDTDLTGDGAEAERPSTEEAIDLDALWNDLAVRESAAAGKAMRTLAAHPERAVPYLGEHLRPAPDDLVGRLVAGLDEDRVEARESASAAIEALGSAAETALRRALDGTATPEVRTRIELLLEPLARPVPPPGSLRRLRAIHILGRIGTPEARAVLDRIAKDAPAGREGREAKAAIDRIGKPGP